MICNARVEKKLRKKVWRWRGQSQVSGLTSVLGRARVHEAQFCAGCTVLGQLCFRRVTAALFSLLPATCDALVASEWTWTFHSATINSLKKTNTMSHMSHMSHGSTMHTSSIPSTSCSLRRPRSNVHIPAYAAAFSHVRDPPHRGFLFARAESVFSSVVRAVLRTQVRRHCKTQG